MDSEMLARIDERTAHICKRVDGIDSKLDCLFTVQQDHAERIAKQETRLGLFAGLAGIFSIVSGWIAGKA